ncbi:MAG: hypothetical protein KAT91_03555 [Candidatus Aenigmarchaeota archaeon]|nr:hypothetical protein [Candidatus Aenigmarchaeota archaeon]
MLKISVKGQTQIISVVLIMGLAVGVIGASYMWGKPLIDKSQAGTTITNAEKTMDLIKNTIDDVAKTGGQKKKQIQIEGSLEVSEAENAIIYTLTGLMAAIASSQWISINDDVPPKSIETYAVDATDPSDSTAIGCGDCVMNSSCLPTETIKISGTCGASGNYVAGSSFNCDLNTNTYTVDHIDCAGNLDGFAVLAGPEKEMSGIVGTNNAGVLVAKSIPSGDEFMTEYKLIYRELIDPTSKEGVKIIIKNQGNSQISSGQHTLTVMRGTIDTENDASYVGGDLAKTTVFVTVE